jgi:peptide/nickel transport system permease protein
MTLSAPPEAAAVAPDVASTTRRFDLGLTWYRVRQSPLTLIGIAIFALVLVAIVFAPWIAPYPPDAVDLGQRLLPPSTAHWFGTDEVGRDILSRVIFGARTSCGAGFGIVALAAIGGLVIGCLAGLAGGIIDNAVMRLMDVMLALPTLVLALALAAALGPSLVNALLAVAVVRLPAYVRFSRAQTLTLRHRNYVRVSRTFGAGTAHILRWHIMPNALSPILVQATLDLGGTILVAAALSFIGLGAQPPTAEWGAMVSTGRNFLLDQWWYATFPGLAILMTAMGCNLLGDGLRDLLDPRLGTR